MTTRYTTVAVGLLVTLALSAGCRGNKSKDPPIHPNWNMDDQQYFQAQEDNDWFPDNRAQRPLVAGTVARGLLKADDHLYRGRGPDGRLVDALPPSLALSQELLDRGEARYDIYCAPCHEKSGLGNGIIAQPGRIAAGLLVKPPSYMDPRLTAMPLGYFFDVITHGKNTMRPYAAQIPVEDRWAIAAWVRVLQVSQRAAMGDVPADTLDQLKSGGAQ